VSIRENTRTASEDALWAAVNATTNASAADLAHAAGIGVSTARKVLSRWETDGSLTRHTGDNPRAVLRWSLTATDTTQPGTGGEPDAVPDPESEGAQPEPEDTAPLAANPVIPPMSAPARTPAPPHRYRACRSRPPGMPGPMSSMSRRWCPVTSPSGEAALRCSVDGSTVVRRSDLDCAAHVRCLARR
jgi:hypothetical protein